VVDNDGTLWCEKPMPIELGFILQRLAAMADQDLSLRQRQPWKAASDRDYGWLGQAITKHCAGDDRDVQVLLGGILQAFTVMDVEDYQAAARAFLHQGRHPTLGRGFHQCGYRPMIDLLGYLEARRHPHAGLCRWAVAARAAAAGAPRRDPEREFDYVAGDERSLEEAKAKGWTVVGIRRDWATVFDD
jgi:hypothetical protein